MYNTVLHTFAKEYNNVKRKNEGSFKKNFLLKKIPVFFPIIIVKA